MKNIYSFLFFIITIFVFLFKNNTLIIESNLTNKFIVFLGLLLINIVVIIYSYSKEQKKIKGIETIKLSLYYSLIGTFAYIILFDLIKINNIELVKNINVQILLYSLFITIITIIFYNKLLL
jgi:hypothetical protein